MPSASASIRYHNPGAMYPGPSAKAFGSRTHEKISDGHLIARFDDSLSGAAAQFHLLKRVYAGMSVIDALDKWSDGNNVTDYLLVIKRRTGLSPDDKLTAAYLRNPRTGIKFARAMAFHEAGEEYPMTGKKWREAHALVYKLASDEALDAHARMVQRAITYVGTSEFKGAKRNNQDILDFYGFVGRKDIRRDEVHWCAAYAGAMAAIEGFKVPKPEDALMARAYLKVGDRVEKDAEEIHPGDWGIWPRGPAPWGHIGIVVSVNKARGTVRIVAGNVSDRVRYQTKSIKSALGFRRPVLSKAKPNGLKPILTTIKDSPTLNALSGGFAFVTTGISAFFYKAYNYVSEYGTAALQVLPEAMTQTEHLTQTAEQTASVLNLAWPLAFSAGLAVLLFAFTLLRGLNERRPER